VCIEASEGFEGFELLCMNPVFSFCVFVCHGSLLLGYIIFNLLR
jgi:hypothetical protein